MYSIQSTTEYLYTSALDKTNTLHTEWCITAQTRKAYACSVDVSLCLFSLSYPRLVSVFSLLSFLFSSFHPLSLPYPACSTLLYSISVFYTLAQLNQGSSAQPESSLFNQSILLSFIHYSFFLSLHSLSSLPSHFHPSLLTPAVTILAVSRFQSQRLLPAQPLLLLSHTYTHSLSDCQLLHPFTRPFIFLIFFYFSSSALFLSRLSIFHPSSIHLFYLFTLFILSLPLYNRGLAISATEIGYWLYVRV